MSEQSDTPSWWRCDTHGPGTRTAWGCPECVLELRERLATATRERDEARALNVEWAKKAETWMASPEAAQRLQSYRDLAQQVAQAQNERDEARADLDRFRHTAKRYRYLTSWCSVMSADIDGNNYWVSRISSARLRGASFEEAVDKAMERDHWERSALAATEAARKFFGVGELERTGYIPAGSADEREAKP